MVNNQIVKKARDFALKAHGGQMYGGIPYIYHLEDVVRILDPYPPDVRIIGYLHDVLEDTAETYENIKDKFGEHIAECVFYITDSPGKNRTIRKRNTYKKLLTIPKKYEQALIVKTADRLANMEACLLSPGKEDLLRMYINEHDEFKKVVYRKNLCEYIWERIAFLIKHRENQ